MCRSSCRRRGAAAVVAVGVLGSLLAPHSRSLAPLPHGAADAKASCHRQGAPACRSTDAAEQGTVLRRSGLTGLGLAASLAVGLPEAQELLSLSRPAHAEAVLTTEEKQNVDLFQRNTPGVVFITSEVYEVSDAAQMEIMAVPTGTGSGWVYDLEGHIITNFHVIKGANALTVRFIDGTQVQAKVVGADPGTDVAVLQVDLPPSKRGLLKPLVRGESTGLNVGQEVYAIGNPFGLDHTLTKGIVSGVGRTIMSVGGRPIQGAIQTDASINPGNSGGPLLNSQGRVIGMNTVIISPSGASAGVGFAIPSDTVSARVASILRYGYVKRPSLGLYLGQDGLARQVCGRPGGYVAGLQRISAAGEAGIQIGDIITQIDERSVKRTNDIYAELDEHEPRESVTVQFLRPDGPLSRSGLPEEGAVYRSFSVKVTLKEAAKET